LTEPDPLQSFSLCTIIGGTVTTLAGFDQSCKKRFSALKLALADTASLKKNEYFL